ncbi:MAG TPA: alpha-hydroxy acid oxidase [Trebonia sp.]|jgi:L-lactate dehydrogenase (cytochrome)|nr:alpha-hydroxy acid oxidase [Trebonia sp.]
MSGEASPAPAARPAGEASPARAVARRLRRIAGFVDWSPRAALRAPSPVSVADLRRAARRRLPPMIFDHVDGGGGQEATLRANVADLRRVTLQPRVLSPVGEVDLSATIGGQRVALPVLLGPTGLARMSHRDGELAAARAAARAGTIFTLSTASSYSLEDVARAAAGPLWFQLYLGRDRDGVRDLVRRVKAAGYRALVLTVDVQTGGQRLRDLRNGLAIPPRVNLRQAAGTLLHPGWLADIAADPPVGFANFADAAGARLAQREYAERLSSPTATWDDLRELRDLWPGTLIVKGILTVPAAEQAVAAGVDGIIVSNHGGRQLDGVDSSISALVRIRAALGARADAVDLLLDGGIRTGADVVRAIAAGARGVLIGRPWVWGLAARGQDGVELCLELLREDIERTMRLLGAPAVAAITGSHAAFPPEWARDADTSTDTTTTTSTSTSEGTTR